LIALPTAGYSLHWESHESPACALDVDAPTGLGDAAAVIVRPTALPEVLLIEPRVHGDARGFFLEIWHQGRYGAAGLPAVFAQDNVSFSARGVLRGLHFQEPEAQGKLVSVLQGEVYDVAVDIRVGSPRFGSWVGAVLSGENHQQLYVPEGFAHGFCVLSEAALVSYKCTRPYAPEAERTLLWSDPAIKVRWPPGTPRVSAKDAAGKTLGELAEHALLPRFQASAAVGPPH
jgi:dTDP-4-dehydrorhamnose 3,5-epimerase